MGLDLNELVDAVAHTNAGSPSEAALAQFRLNILARMHTFNLVSA